MPETLFLATALIDRYLAKAQVARKNLQLVRRRGAPAMPRARPLAPVPVPRPALGTRRRARPPRGPRRLRPILTSPPPRACPPRSA
jgi:hypothetical protein